MLAAHIFSACPVTAQVDPNRVLSSDYQTISLSDVSELSQRFTEQSYSWPPTSSPAVVPRFIVAELPRNWADGLNTEAHQSLFIRLILPLILLNNENVLTQRSRLLEIIAARTPSESEQRWLRSLYSDYGLDRDDSPQMLLERVDQIPASLALAQAILESGWGTSRFTEMGNALYAEWVWGSGIEPRQQREELGDYGIESFSSLLRSAHSYVNNLNSNEAYASFRRRRAELREQGVPPSGCKMASLLSSYAELDIEEYASRLCELIEQNQLRLADTAKLGSGVSVLVEFTEASQAGRSDNL